MDRRHFLAGLISSAMIPAARADTNQVFGGGFQGGEGFGNVITGDKDTARNAYLENCVVNGRGAAIDARAISTTLIGDGCGNAGDFVLCDLSGQYLGHAARLRRVAAKGYAALEHADAEGGAFTGPYAGHSVWARHSSGYGDSVLTSAVVWRTEASGHYAGRGAEGEDLVFNGDGATTARVSGEPFMVSEILIGDEKLTPWIVKRHGFGMAGDRVNLFVTADEMPTNAYMVWGQGAFLPFTVLGPDEIQYVGNKYRALTDGRNVTVARNTCRPKRSTAIGAGSIITRDDQVVINGVDMTGQVEHTQALEARLEAIEASRRTWWPFD